MCGIAGIINLRFPDINLNTLGEMSSALSSRGPDNEDFYVNDHVGLAHRRLSIIDLAGGDQPMSCENDRYTLIFNGEIYNYRELKQALQKQGLTFATQSDSEVLLKLFTQKGPSCLQDLNGMFAFAVWDKQTQTLFAARDRMGQKPFYYALLDNYFIFASELKALLKFPELEKKLNPKALQYFFTYEYIPEPHSIIQDVQKLPAGHFLTLNSSELQIKRYWNPRFEPKLQLDERQASKELLEHLDKAVNYRMIADVPLGVFLSGGLDSSSIVALMARHREGKDISTFSIDFEEASFDESLYSQTIAQKFGTNHHKQTLNAKKMLEILPDVVRYMDEPFADGSILPTYLLSQFTRQNVKVALGGDGADEIFCGYPTFFATRYAQKFDKLPRFLQKSAQGLAKILPRSEKNMSLDFKLKQFLLAKDYNPLLKKQIWLAGIPPHLQNDLFQKDFLHSYKASEFELIQQELNHCDSKNLNDQLLYFYQKFYLNGDILTKTDRASMAHSLEVRAPYLDVNVVEYVNKLPYELKLKGVTTKYLLKKIFNRTLPAMITQRPKKGFGIPIASWLKSDLKDKLLQTLNPERLQKEGYFQPQTVKTYIDEHLSGKENHRKPLFCLLMLHLWMDEYLT